MALSNGTGSGGDFFPVEEHRNAKAILIETTKILKDQPGKWGNRDIGVADFTVFPDIETLNGDKEPAFLQGTRIDKKWIVQDMEEKFEAGEDIVAKLVARPNPNGDKPIWVIRSVDDAIFSMVADYVAKRDEELAAAMAEDEPDWA